MHYVIYEVDMAHCRWMQRIVVDLAGCRGLAIRGEVGDLGIV